MTANIVYSFVFDPGLGQVRAGFFFSRYGFDFRATVDASRQPRKNKQREKTPAPGAGLIAGKNLMSRQSAVETAIRAIWRLLS